MTQDRFHTKTITVCLMVLTTIAIGAALYWLRPVLLPFILALFFVAGIVPVLDFFERRLHTPRILAVVITFLLGILLSSLLWVMVWFSVASLLQDADTYRARFRELVSAASERIGFKEEKSDDADEPSHSAAASHSDAAGADVADTLPTVDDRDVDAGNLEELLNEYFRTGLGRLSSALLDLLSSAMMVLIFTFFLLLGGSTSALPRTGVWVQIESQIRSYIVAKTVISLVTGGIFGLVLWLFGVPLALVFGVLAFLLNFIPNIGPVIASLLPLPLIVLSPELSLAAMVAVIVLTVSVQFISGNIVEPMIMGDSFELHPVAILVTLMLWGMIWGIVGMFLATPITAALKILLEKFEPTRPIADLLAGNLDAFTRDEKPPPAKS